VLATGTTAARSLAARYSDILNIKDFGAALNGTTDDTAAWTAAINAMNVITAAGGIAAVYMPPGISCVNGSTLPYIKTNGAIIGAGPAQSVVQMGISYSGTLFAWSGNSWQGQSLLQSGPTIKSISIFGQNVQSANTYNTSSPTQHAVMINDCTDFSLIEDVQIFCVAGRAIGCGLLGATSSATFREAVIRNVRIFNCGNGSLPNFEISNNNQVSSTPIQIEDVRIYSPYGPGMVFRSPSAAGGVGPRGINARGVFIEGNQFNNFAGNLLQIGDTTNSAGPAGITFLDLTLLNPYSGYNGLALLSQSNSMSSTMYAYWFQCASLSDVYARCQSLVYISGGREIFLSSPQVSGATAIMVPPASYVTGYVEIDFCGMESTLTYSIAAYALPSFRNSATAIQGNPANAQASFQFMLQGTTSTTSAVRLTSDGNAATYGNICSVAPGKIGIVNVRVIAKDTTAALNNYGWYLPGVVVGQPYGAPSYTVSAANSPIINTMGTTTGASVSLTADKTNGGINLTFTPPTGNADTWNVYAIIEGIIP
jgi:hypothetical protein